MNILIICIITITSLLFLFILFRLSNVLIRYFEEKIQTDITVRTRELEKPLTEPVAFIDKIDSTVSLLNLINVLIDNEISRMLESLNKLHTPYDTKNMDKDIKMIAESVFNGLSKEINFNNNEIIITNEYIMKHISEETVTRLMIKAIEYNTGINLTK